MGNGLTHMANVLYPGKCPICEKVTGTASISCCSSCERELPFITGERCMKCGKPVAEEETQYCLDCSKKKHLFEQGLALWSYDSRVKQAVYRFKYKNRREYAAYFGRELVRHYYRQMEGWGADAVLPVPLHAKRYKKRGFNQAELLAKEIGRYLHLPVYADFLLRMKNTKPQKELNEKERQKNLKNAFKIDENSVKLKKVILVDDIYTTGATVDIISEVLKEAGIDKVYVVSLCIGKGY